MTLATMQPRMLTANMTDICLYLPYFAPSSELQQVLAGNVSAMAGGPNYSDGYTAAVGDPLLETIKYVLAGIINPTCVSIGLLYNFRMK